MALSHSSSQVPLVFLVTVAEDFLLLVRSRQQKFGRSLNHCNEIECGIVAVMEITPK